MTVRATVIGAGGLGGPVALALGAAGIELTIVDPDVVEVSNLHRQIQFTDADLGQPKAPALAALVERRGGRARGYQTAWRSDDADELSGDADLLVDGSDDPATKFAVADWAVANGRRYVIAAAVRFGGNVVRGLPGTACYRCLFEEPVVAATCSEAGVLGPIVGAIGGVAAAVALSLARGERARDPLGLVYAFEDLRLAADPRIVRFLPRAGCPACARAALPPTGERVLVAGAS